MNWLPGYGGKTFENLEGLDNADWVNACSDTLAQVEFEQAVANATMAMKKRGGEPTATALKEQCPHATWNPETSAPISDKYIHSVLKERCFDEGSSVPWTNSLPNKQNRIVAGIEELALVVGSEAARVGSS